MSKLLRLLHTADWHLGHTLKGHERAVEHDVFLRWLVQTIAERAVDVVVIAGDVFDQANPSARAQAQFYDFLAAVHRARPDVDIVVIAGNHDSPARLDAPHPVLRSLRVHVVGALNDDSRARLAVEVMRADGSVGARVVAIPFLRPGDLARPTTSPDAPAPSYAEVVGNTYRAAVDALPAADADTALVLLGHMHVRGGDLSPDSERRLIVGGEEALPPTIFPDATYVALGHLHKAQKVGAPHVRYSGSPLPLSFAEIGYQHQVLEVVIDGATLSSVTSLPVPRPAPVLRVPPTPAGLDDVLAAVRALPVAPAAPGLEPLLEVQLSMSTVPSDLRARLDEALQGKNVRVASVRCVPPTPAATSTSTSTSTSTTTTAEAVASARQQLDELTPEALFSTLLAEHPEIIERDDVLAAFGEALDLARQGET
jgi:exonuclease SbcD